MPVPILFLHGYTDSVRSFEPLLDALPSSVEGYVLTHRDHGDSAGLAAFMDAAGLDAAVVVGHSAGSYTAQRFAVDHPERTLGLVLLGAFRSAHDHPGVNELWEAVAGLSDPVDPAFAAEFQRSTMARPVPPEFLEMVVGESLSLPAAIWRSSLRSLIDAPVPSELGTIAAPTLILWGEQDAICSRAEQDALVEAIPDARLLVYPGTGHAPHWEEPGRVAADIAAFVSSRALSRPRSAVAR